MVWFANVDQSPQVLSRLCGIEACVERRLALCWSWKDYSVTWAFDNMGELYCLVSQGAYAGNRGLHSH